ncbi:MAG: aminomethyl-transferring glycine dehydrogenase subunit GcvPB [Oscillospiraceae bacterium]|nr:aminomethyl-transferring glycine dehydrogenase subunit GcvPB [Oscillospiraceae bacterium]
MKLLFERSVPGRRLSILPACDVPAYDFDKTLLRAAPPRLPELSETDVSRHYTELAKQTFGVNDGFYPLGSCTMKYNPRADEEAAALPGFTRIHPLQPAETAQGCLAVLCAAEKALCAVTGMDAMTFQPAAGAHGEFTGLLLIKAYHRARGDAKRTRILVPDSAHGTNPASAAMNGMQVVSLPSGPDGCVDLAALRAALSDEVAGLMLTNPNTVGVFDKNILEITRLVHGAGGLCYYDGANLNAVMGIVRPGDMGFDVVHLNLHKTFATPHGGGGPGSGACGCKDFLRPFLPLYHAIELPDGRFGFEMPEKSVGSVRSFYGNFLVVVRALAYILTLGREGIPEAAENAVLNANYLKHLLEAAYEPAYPGRCMHEFVLTLAGLKQETGVSAMDVAKKLLDYGMHPPTMYFPLIVHEALMFEPTETEGPETLEAAADAMREIFALAHSDPAALHAAPAATPIGRPDEVTAAREPRLRYDFGA